MGDLIFICFAAYLIYKYIIASEEREHDKEITDKGYNIVNVYYLGEWRKDYIKHTEEKD